MTFYILIPADKEQKFHDSKDFYEMHQQIRLAHPNHGPISHSPVHPYGMHPMHHPASPSPAPSSSPTHHNTPPLSNSIGQQVSPMHQQHLKAVNVPSPHLHVSSTHHHSQDLPNGKVSPMPQQQQPQQPLKVHSVPPPPHHLHGTSTAQTSARYLQMHHQHPGSERDQRPSVIESSNQPMLMGCT